ncbi:hypothetical protein SUGI_0588080 [Cryptomeria japonica]|uniref:probable WRKY transcription factor 43 n=1 Tax=Cryptomeria japonica TaxID=3369 RepID=UPI0024148A88|nr:probable WRKY transcription factor 43 [Cryptomeria japonica]GLJ29781.1 hypothetical protein SUGI_0588080 [Cryptomeria japonica]
MELNSADPTQSNNNTQPKAVMELNSADPTQSNNNTQPKAVMELNSADPTQSDNNTQPNIITLKTRSETDILDDGYRWKKYGQKQIKNSHYQRHYFKCEVKGCVVKKKIQRCDDDSQFVLTTYEGIHNHPSHDIQSFLLRNSYDLRTQFHQAPANTFQ